MPDFSRLIAQKIEAEGVEWVYQIGGGIEQKSDALRVFRVESEVEGLFFFDPCDTMRQGKALCLRPGRPVRDGGCGGLSCAAWSFFVCNGHIG